MHGIIRVYYWLKHGIFSCPKDALDHPMYGAVSCRICGRTVLVSRFLSNINMKNGRNAQY